MRPPRPKKQPVLESVQETVIGLEPVKVRVKKEKAPRTDEGILLAKERMTKVRAARGKKEVEVLQ